MTHYMIIELGTLGIYQALSFIRSPVSFYLRNCNRHQDLLNNLTVTLPPPYELALFSRVPVRLALFSFAAVLAIPACL
jgi:hypothetical protein